MNLLPVSKKGLFLALGMVAVISLGVGYGAGTMLIPQLTSQAGLSQALMPAGRIDESGTAPATEAEITGEAQKEVSNINRPGKIAVVFSAPEVKVGESVTAQISLDTGGETIKGFDILLTLDPQEWQVLQNQVTVNQTQAFTAYPVNAINQETGEVQLSGITNAEEGFTGDLVVGSFLLQPKKAGTLKLEVKFAGEGDPNDTNLALSGTTEDILGGVENGMLEVEE